MVEAAMIERTARTPLARALACSAGAIASAAALCATPAAASDGGASLYLLGSGGPGAAMLPPVEGVFFDNTFYYYDGSAEATRQFVVGGNVVAGLDATIAADFVTLLWVPSTDVLGGTFAIGASLPAGLPDVTVSAVLTGPLGGTVGVSREDDAF